MPPPTAPPHGSNEGGGASGGAGGGDARKAQRGRERVAAIAEARRSDSGGEAQRTVQQSA